jgi:hypothetical protein
LNGVFLRFFARCGGAADGAIILAPRPAFPYIYFRLAAGDAAANPARGESQQP